MSGPSADPKPCSKEQYLFLLEFFVHYITGERVSKLNETLRGPSSIAIKFLGIQNDSIEITPAYRESSPLARSETQARDVEKFYSGRSIMFAIPQAVVVNKNTEFKINLRVYKKMPADIHPDVLIGTGELDITNEFAGLRKEMFDCWNCDVPPPKNYEGPVEIYYHNQLAAFVLAYVRISSFGQSIITAFDAPATERAANFIFKGDVMDHEGLVYNCKLLSHSLLNLKANQRSNYQLDPPFCQPTICPRQDAVDGGIEDILLARSFESPVTEPCGQPLVFKISGAINKDGNFNNNGNEDGVDVFVLRIGKKGLVGEGEKSDIQIELRTPKTFVETLPVRCETREIQTEDLDDDKAREEIEVKKSKSKEKSKKKKKKKNKSKKKKKK